MIPRDKNNISSFHCPNYLWQSVASYLTVSKKQSNDVQVCKLGGTQQGTLHTPFLYGQLVWVALVQPLATSKYSCSLISACCYNISQQRKRVETELQLEDQNKIYLGYFPLHKARWLVSILILKLKKFVCCNSPTCLPQLFIVVSI